MSKRKKHVKTEYEKQRKKYRNAVNKHVLVVEADMPEDDKRFVFNLSNKLRILRNELTGILNVRLKQLKHEKAYRLAKKKYFKAKENRDKYNEDSEQYKLFETEHIAAAKELETLYAKYKITLPVLKKDALKYQKELNLNSVFVLTSVLDVWSGVEKVLYSNAQKLHFKKKGELPIIRATQITRAISLRQDKNGFFVSMKGISGIRFKYSEDALFIKDELQKLNDYFNNPGIEEAAAKLYSEQNVLTYTNRPCYCALKCEEIRGRLRVFVQITIDGLPSIKRRKDGSLRHDFSRRGPVGTDTGAQSFAVVSKDKVILKNLAERNSTCTKESEPEERRLLRKMDRSRRANNPDKYNKDGTIKKGNKDPWVKSNTYKKDSKKLKDIRRKNRLNRKYAIQEDVNTIRTLGDTLITESSNAKQMQKKAKFDEDNPTKKRKRFGRSVQNRCPGGFHQRLKEVFEITGGKFIIVDKKFRASQYDHKKDEYIKKNLNMRWHCFEDNIKVQRDLYSAFLMYCSNENATSPDREKCLSNFENFYNLEQELISYIKINNISICNSGI